MANKEKIRTLNIEWRVNDTEVYVNNLYAGYISPLNNKWYGCVLCKEAGITRTLQHFKVTDNKIELTNDMSRFIEKNYENVLAQCKIYKQLNYK